MKKLGFLSLLVLLIFASCRKDTDMTTVTEEVPTPPIVEGYQPLIEIINGDLMGQVIDEANEPIADATVTMNGSSTTTNIYGHFFYSDVDMNSKGQYITMEKDGYFLGSRRFFPQADAQSRVKVQMLEKSFTQSFTTNSPESVIFENVTIDFPGNGIVDAGGTAYNGTVFVAAKWLNPTELSVYEQMPGNLQGINTESDAVALKTLGMVAVELQGESGQKLNIAEGSGAAFTYTLPDALLQNAPETVPLWSFDEEEGMWVQEGTATLENGQYVGEFSHFSFWNWDIPEGNVYFSVTFQDQDGNPIQNALVVLTSDSYGTGYGYTDDMGYVSGAIPIDASLTLELMLSFQCGNSIYSAEVGPFAADTDLGIIAVDNPTVNATSVSGTLVNCDGAAITNGVVITNINGYNNFSYTTEGNFDILLSNCGDLADIELVGYDFDALLSSNPISLTSGVANALGNVSVCDNDISENMITFSYNGNTFSYIATGNSSVNGTFISAFEGQDVDMFFGVGAEVTTTGDYTEMSFNEIFSEGNQDTWGFITVQGSGEFTSFVITEFGANLAGTFTFTAVDSVTFEEVSIEGSFNVTL